MKFAKSTKSNSKLNNIDEFSTNMAKDTSAKAVDYSVPTKGSVKIVSESSPENAFFSTQPIGTDSKISVS